MVVDLMAPQALQWYHLLFSRSNEDRPILYSNLSLAIYIQNTLNMPVAISRPT